mgnify:FL=1
MAMTISKFKSFEEVVKHYKSIKPIKEQDNGTSRNIRPIGDRARKWETIQKINRNCYVLSCGHERGNELFGHWGYAATSDDTDYKVKLENYAPIVWRKHRDGSTSVKINNMCGSDSGCDISHYSFLRRHLPDGMEFHEPQGNAKRYVRYINVDRRDWKVEDVFLAKKSTVPRAEYDNKPDNKWFEWMTPKDDNSSLVFTLFKDHDHSVTLWEHDKTTGQKEPRSPRVNKSVKVKYADHINKLYEWGMTMTPLLPLRDTDYVVDKINELMEYSHDRFKTNEYASEPDYRLVREILRREQHPYRLHFWLMFVRSTNDGWSVDPRYAVSMITCKEDAVRVRARYNRFMNKVARFMEKN